MAEKLSRWVKTSYPYVKEGAGLAPWVLPEHGFNRMVDQAGDQGISKLAEPLGLGNTVNQLLERIESPLDVSPGTWQDAVSRWRPLSQIGSVVAAFQEVAGPVTAHLQSNRGKFNVMDVCRSLAVLLVAPFVEPGKGFLGEVAGVLGIEADPTRLIKGYGKAVCRNDIATLEKVNWCLAKYPPLREWATALQKEVQKCGYIPKLVAVTPTLSPDLINVLAAMMKEVTDEPGRDNRGYPGEPVVAQ